MDASKPVAGLFLKTMRIEVRRAKHRIAVSFMIRLDIMIYLPKAYHKL